MKKGDIVGVYENYTVGERLTGGRNKSKRHLFDYAIEHEGMVRDAWDPVIKKLGQNPGQYNPAHTPGSTKDTTHYYGARCAQG